MAKCFSISGGALFARVGRKPSRARPKLPSSRTTIVTTIPRTKLRISDPRKNGKFGVCTLYITGPRLWRQQSNVSTRAVGEPRAPDRKLSAEKIPPAAEKTELACRATSAAQSGRRDHRTLLH